MSFLMSLMQGAARTRNPHAKPAEWSEEELVARKKERGLQGKIYALESIRERTEDQEIELTSLRSQLYGK